MTTTTIRSAAPSLTRPAGRTTDLLPLTVTGNDPQLQASATAFGMELSGTATNNGTVASSVQLRFDAQTLKVQLSRGDTSATVSAKIRRALPQGYELRILQNDRMNPPHLTLGIAKKPLEPAKVPTHIATNQAGAEVEAKLWHDLMPGSPHPNVVGSVTVIGIGFADAPPKLTVKSIGVYEKGTGRKVATLERPKVADWSAPRESRRQTYAVSIPAAKLDLNKQYTFVVETGINGSKPQAVRSPFVKIDRVY